MPMPPHNGLKSRIMPYGKRVQHLANQLAPNNPRKQQLIKELPLFELALRGKTAFPRSVWTSKRQQKYIEEQQRLAA